MKNIICYHLTNGEIIEQETPCSKEYIDERTCLLFAEHYKFVFVEEKNIYIPISSILYIEVKET